MRAIDWRAVVEAALVALLALVLAGALVGVMW